MARLPLLTPRTITYDQSLPAKNLPFPSCGQRVSPIQAASCHLQSGHGECLPAIQLYLSVFTCPTVSLDLPSDASEVLPARQSYYSVFTCPTQRVLISRWTPARCSRPDNLTFSVFTCPTQQVLISRWMPARCSRPDNLTFSVFTCPTQRVLISRWTPARCSRPDKRSSFCSHQKYRTPSNATYPAVLAILAFSPPPARFDHPAHEYQSHVRCRKSLPAGQPFPPSSAKLTHQTGGHPTSWMSAKHPDQTLPFRLHLSDAVSLDLPSDAGEVLPARQPYLF